MLRDYIELPLPVRILCLGSLINRAGSFVVIFLTIYASEAMNLGVGFAAACMGAFGFGSMCGSILGGQLADQIGRRTVMLMALFGGALLLLLVGSMQDRWTFMASVGLFAVVSQMYNPAASAMIADHVSVEHRPHAFALMYISVNLGFAIAPPIGGLLAEYSFRWLFFGDAFSMILYGLIIVAFITESPADHRAAPAEETHVTPIGPAAVRISRDAVFMLWCFSMFMIELVFMQGMTTLPIYIRQLGLSHLQFGMLMSVNGFLIFLLQLPLTHWLTRFNSMSVLVAGAILIAIGFGLCSFSGSFIFLALTIAIWTLGEILQAPFTQAIVTEMAPVDLRGRYLGVFTMCYALAMTVGAPIGGQVLSRYGPQVLWSGTFVVATAAVAMFIALHRPDSRRIEQESHGDATDDDVPAAVPAASTQ